MAVREKEMIKDGYLPLFETKGAKRRIPYWLYAGSMFSEPYTSKGGFWTTGLDWFVHGRAVIQLVLAHNPTCSMESYPSIPAKGDFGRPAWIGSFMAELLFSLYWLITQRARWNPIRRYTFKERLYQRYEEVLPSIDVFVCTADPLVESPLMVINTVLSLMAYNYPPEKLNIYLSDDGGSDLMFYALLEASRFSMHWLPFCRKLKIEPRSPAAYFATVGEPTNDPAIASEWSSIK
ncbi:hypothetical protein RJ639_045434, partial [Escallonia herrerae]